MTVKNIGLDCVHFFRLDVRNLEASILTALLLNTCFKSAAPRAVLLLELFISALLDEIQGKDLCLVTFSRQL